MAGSLTDLGERIRLLRQERGLSQRALGEPLIPGALISRIESGRATPSPEALRHFADRLGLPDSLTAALGTPAMGRDDLEQVAEDALTFGLADIWRTAQRRLGELAVQRGDFADALAHFEDAGDVCRRVVCLASAGDPVSAVALGEAALGSNDRTDPEALALIYAALTVPYGQIGAFARSAAAAQQALALSARSTDPDLLAQVHRAVAHSHIDRRRFADALFHADEAVRLLPDHPLDEGLSRLTRAIALKGAQRLAEAADDLAAVIELFVASDAPYHLARARAMLTGVRLEQGQAVSVDLSDCDPWTSGYLHRVAALATDDPATAEALLRASVEIFGRWGGAMDMLESSRELGRLLTRLGRLTEAVEAYDLGLGRVKA